MDGEGSVDGGNCPTNPALKEKVSNYSNSFADSTLYIQ